MKLVVFARIKVKQKASRLKNENESDLLVPKVAFVISLIESEIIVEIDSVMKMK